MVNTDDFIKKLEIILDYNGLNASSFADKIGVQRSSLSHLLSGRNKPSLDFILKIIEVFPDVDLYWILNGKGSYPKIEEKSAPILTATPPTLKDKNLENQFEIQTDLFSEKLSESKKTIDEKIINSFPNPPISTSNANNDKIDRIVIFFKNGTFKTYSPE